MEPEDQYVSPANMLVSEMMIMAGEVVATFCADNKIPVPFRGQVRRQSRPGACDCARHACAPVKGREV